MSECDFLFLTTAKTRTACKMPKFYVVAFGGKYMVGSFMKSNNGFCVRGYNKKKKTEQKNGAAIDLTKTSSTAPPSLRAHSRKNLGPTGTAFKGSVL